MYYSVNPILGNNFQLDTIYILFIAISVIFGYLHGFSTKLSNISVFFYSIFVAILCTPHAVPIVNKYIQHIPTAKYFSVFISYIISIVAFMLIASTTPSKKVNHKQNKFDKIYRILFGSIRGLFISLCCCVLILTFKENINIQNYKQSKLSYELFKFAKLWMPTNDKPIIKKQITGNPPYIKNVKNEIRTVEDKKQQKPPALTDATNKNKQSSIIKYIADFFARVLSGLTPVEDKSPHIVPTHVKPSVHKNQNTIRAKYGCMSLLDAWKKRKKQLQKERLENKIIKHLNNKKDWIIELQSE